MITEEIIFGSDNFLKLVIHVNINVFPSYHSLNCLLMRNNLCAVICKSPGRFPSLGHDKVCKIMNLIFKYAFNEVLSPYCASQYHETL